MFPLATELVLVSQRTHREECNCRGDEDDRVDDKLEKHGPAWKRRLNLPGTDVMITKKRRV